MGLKPISSGSVYGENARDGFETHLYIIYVIGKLFAT